MKRNLPIIAMLLSAPAFAQSTTPVPITNLPAASLPLSGKEAIPISQKGVTVQVPASAVGPALPLSVLQGGTGISIADVVHTATYGSICDGGSHPLSSITSYRGQNSTGWSVAQWQVQFPSLPNGADLTAQQIDNWAISAAWEKSVAAGHPAYIWVDGTICNISYSIDHTQNRSIKNMEVDYSSVQLVSTAAGMATVDLTGSATTTIDNLYVTGSCANGSEPYDGILIARGGAPSLGAAARPSSTVLLNRPKSDGCFTHSSLDIVQSELDTYNATSFVNSDTSGTGRAITADGTNHFNVAVVQKFFISTQPVDTYQSFTQNSFTGVGTATCTCDGPIWLGSVHNWKFDNFYTNNNKSLQYGYILWETASAGNTDIVIHGRSEGLNDLISTFYMTGDGTNPNPIIPSLKYRNSADWSTVSLFSLDRAHLTTGRLGNASIEVDIFARAGVPTLFDNPANWSGTGDVTLEFQSNWQLYPGMWQGGKVCIGTTVTCINIVPIQPLNNNSEFNYDKKWGYTLVPANTPNLTQISDQWIAHIEGTTSNATFQDLHSGCKSSNYGEQITVTNPTTIGSNALFSIRSFMTGPVMSEIWASAQFPPLIRHIRWQANYNGIVSLFAQSPGNNFVYVIEMPVSNTGTCQDFAVYIPQPSTGGGWDFAQNQQGLIYGIMPDCGSNLYVTPGVWTTVSARSAFCSPNTTHFLANSGNQLTIYFDRIYSGNFLPIYQPWPDAQSTAENNRYFEKSVPLDVVSTDGTYQNLGRQGAIPFTVRVNGDGVTTQTGYVPYPYTMFGPSTLQPSVTTASTDAASTDAYDTTGSKDCGPLSVLTSTSSNNGFTYVATPPVGVLAGDVCMFNYTAQAFQ